MFTIQSLGDVKRIGERALKKHILPSNRKFGFFLGSIFLIASAYSVFIDHQISAILFSGFAVSLFFISVLCARLLFPLNWFWMKLGLILSMIVNPCVMGIVFFFVVTPISIFFKIIGRDELELKSSIKKSYWTTRSSKERNRTSFLKQH